jgi:hypothetical protein
MIDWNQTIRRFPDLGTQQCNARADARRGKQRRQYSAVSDDDPRDIDGECNAHFG